MNWVYLPTAVIPGSGLLCGEHAGCRSYFSGIGFSSSPHCYPDLHLLPWLHSFNCGFSTRLLISKSTITELPNASTPCTGPDYGGQFDGSPSDVCTEPCLDRVNFNRASVHSSSLTPSGIYISSKPIPNVHPYHIESRRISFCYPKDWQINKHCHTG